MMYCVKKDYFQFNPKKVSSIKEAYYNQIDSDCEIIKLFNDLESAEGYLNLCTPSFHRFSYTLAEATVYMITECEWYFDDDYYRNEETGELERTFADLETFDDIIFKADDEWFEEVM